MKHINLKIYHGFLNDKVQDFNKTTIKINHRPTHSVFTLVHCFPNSRNGMLYGHFLKKLILNYNSYFIIADSSFNY